ncbi:MAG: hypothetical protein OEY28_13915, partial [Nitrospira sp.]|nr:hypothetical protein [Nitrospira sp.]
MREFPHFAVWALSLLAAAVLVGCVKDSPGRPSPVPAKKWVETAPAAPADMSIEELLKAYRDSLPELKKPEPRPEKSELADELARRAPSGAAELAVSLHDEGHDVRDLLEALAIALHHEIEYEDPDTGRRGFKKNPLFIEVTRRLGWQAYREPENFRMFQQWNFREFKPYQKRLFELTREYRGSTSFSQAHIDELRVLERPIIEKGNRILADHEKDRFAINAREAYVRFCERNNAGPVNRAKNKRMFSPRAMGRETEQVEEIWDYCYAKPFVLYVERPLDVNEAEFASRIDSNTELLQALHTWFMVEFVEKFELKRVKPIGPGGLGKDGVTGYSTGTERAEADG